MPTILIVDDSAVLRERVRETLRDHGVADIFLMAEDGAEGLKLLLSEQVDLVLLDLLMPGLDGFKFLSLKKQKESGPAVPVIVLTGTDEVDDKIRGFAEGASDYLTKPFHDLELVARVKVHLQVKLMTEQLRQMARTDPLTGLANRGYFTECLERELHRASRCSAPVGLIMIDIDFFKEVNDEYGHQAGDALLIKIAEELPRGLRSSDLVGRYGGEEFVMLLPDADDDGVRIVAERCRRQISTLRVPFDNQVLTGTASFGAVSSQQPGCTVRDIVRAADLALYEAKQDGRNRVVLSKGLAENSVQTEPAPKKNRP
jgi:two-component system cell cycle response regulator